MKDLIEVHLPSRDMTVRVPVAAARVLLACEELRNTVSRNWEGGAV